MFQHKSNGQEEVCDRGDKKRETKEPIVDEEVRIVAEDCRVKGSEEDGKKERKKRKIKKEDG